MTRWRSLVLAACALAAFVATACENEGRSDEARSTVLRYLAALDGAEDDRGWSVLSESMRSLSGSREAYVELASQADDPLSIESVTLHYEDDGFYDFTVTTAEPIGAAHAAALFDEIGSGSAIACSIGPDSFRIAVIVGVLMFTEHTGITGNECPPPTKR
jgi:hypothetical protein